MYVMLCQELTENSQTTRFTTSYSNVLNYAPCYCINKWWPSVLDIKV